MLREVVLPVVADDACAAAYADEAASDNRLWTGFDPKTMLCAGDTKKRTGICNGDSGGPLFAAPPGAAADQVRVVGSASYGYCDESHPSIYARVGEDALRAWIASVAPNAVRD